MPYDYKANRIASATSGECGMPGDTYNLMWISVATHPRGFEARAKWARGSNQGYLEEHDSQTGRCRGSSPADALQGLLGDALDWDTGQSAGEIRSAFRECEYEADDHISGD